MSARREAFFVDAPGGQRFCLVTRPQGRPVGGLLHVPPFAEEMNKSRRMVALAAQAFAARGWLVLQIDPLGCGDSSGDFGDATWQDWLADVDLGWRWLEANCAAPRVAWSLRAGGLLVADWLKAASARPPLLMWQPVSNGHQHLTQFLRLRAANEMLAESDAKAAMVRIRAELQAGNAVEVAGYALSPALANGLDAAALVLPAGHPAPVALIEASRASAAAPSPAVAALAEKLKAAGIAVLARAVEGPAFWQTQEIETAPALVEASVTALEHLVA